MMANDDPDATFTRVISKTFELDGVTFCWWYIDESPAFVTVSSQWFGSRADLTRSDPESFAKKLARDIMDERYKRAASMRDRGKPE